MDRDRDNVPAALRRPIEHPPIRLALRQDEAAQALGVCSKTLRDLPNGPAFVAVGRARLYPVTALQAWLDERATRPADDETVPADDLTDPI